MSDFKGGFDDLGLHLTMDEVALIFKDQGVSKSGIIRTGEILDLLVVESELNYLKTGAESAADTAKVTHKYKRSPKGTRNRPQTGSVRSATTSQTGRPTSATTGGKMGKSPGGRLTMEEI